MSFLRKFLKKDETPHCSAVIVAAGSSARMGFDKLSYELCGSPVLMRTISAFENCELVDEIILVTKADRLHEVAELCASCGFDKLKKVVIGGASRMESALAGVSEVSSKAKLIAIHDAARPFVSNELICSVVYAAKKYLAAVPVLASTDTLKSVDENGIVIGGVDRASTVRVQTPQIFDADLIKGALTHAVKKQLPLTDDCSAMELMGVSTHTVPGDPDNIKITSPSDIPLAEAIIRKQGESL